MREILDGFDSTWLSPPDGFSFSEKGTEHPLPELLNRSAHLVRDLAIRGLNLSRPVPECRKSLNLPDAESNESGTVFMDARDASNLLNLDGQLPDS